jgi:hypothetical protein
VQSEFVPAAVVASREESPRVKPRKLGKKTAQRDDELGEL